MFNEEKLKEIRKRLEAWEKETVPQSLARMPEKDENLMPTTLKAVKAYATVGEICNVLREVYGEYRPPMIF